MDKGHRYWEWVESFRKTHHTKWHTSPCQQPSKSTKFFPASGWKKNDEKKSRMGFLRWLEIFRNSSSVCPWRQVISKFPKWRHWEPATSSISRLLEYPARQRKEIGTILGLKTCILFPHHITSLQWFYYLSPISHYPNSQPNPLNKAGCISNIQPTRLYLRHQPNRVTQTYPTNASELTQHFATRSLEPSNWMSSNDSKASVLRPTQGPERNASSSLC